jgi:hypothetical protein
MSKVKIQGNASGTGVVTLTAPNTNTDRTITLPDATTTIATTAEVALKAPIASPEFTGAITTTTDMVVQATSGSRKMFMGVSSDDLAIGNYSGSNTVRNEHLKITSDGRGLSQFTAKAWVNFNGTGTVSIRDSHNVSSIGDYGVGHYYVNFSNNLANVNYATVGGTVVPNFPGTIRINPDAVSRCRIWTSSSTGSTYNDASVASVIVFGD